ARPVAVRVFEHRGDRARGRTALERMRPLQPVPPEVRPAIRARGLEVDLLPRALPDIADPQVTGRRVEREAPRVPQAVGPDLWARTRPADERVVRGDRVRLARRGSGRDPQQLAEERRE